MSIVVSRLPARKEVWAVTVRAGKRSRYRAVKASFVGRRVMAIQQTYIGFSEVRFNYNPEAYKWEKTTTCSVSKWWVINLTYRVDDRLPPWRLQDATAQQERFRRHFSIFYDMPINIKGQATSICGSLYVDISLVTTILQQQIGVFKIFGNVILKLTIKELTYA